jgi:precorrin-3B synthase
MTAHALNLPQRRGACPGLSAPMATGDGLLVRFLPTGTMTLDAFARLCAAAQRYGNGVIEVTARGSIQIRGLNTASAPRFASAIAACGIAAADGIPVLSNPLTGLDPEDIIDSGALAGEVRDALADSPPAQELSAKVSVTVDGGGPLNLDTIAADVRLAATHGDAVAVSVGGDAAGASHLGVVALKDGTAVVLRLLEILALHGRDARTRDVIRAKGIAAFRTAIADLIINNRATASQRRSGDAIGSHPLRNGSLACGVGLAFGHADASSLQRLTEAAAAAGASGLRTAPGRALMILGLTPKTAPSFGDAAAALGFIVRADDSRRHVIACAGAPICASAEIASRALAPHIAAAAAPHLNSAFRIHISGCAKGCAHPAAAALTVVGTPQGCALVANGTARDAPFKLVASADLPAAVAAIERGGGHV